MPVGGDAVAANRSAPVAQARWLHERAAAGAWRSRPGPTGGMAYPLCGELAPELELPKAEGPEEELELIR